MSFDNLGDRIKVNYESIYSDIRLPMRMPVIIRLDGKAFHTVTRECKKPFDDSLIELMDNTAKYVCENIQGAQVAYVQSDEISILLHNYKKLNSQAWFGNELQKMVSVSAALASSYFSVHSNKVFNNGNKIVAFDSRVMVMPENEVCNYFIWRQQDNIRNSVQMLARSLFSHKECENKVNAELQEMCSAVGHNWEELATKYKRGRCIIKTSETFKKDNLTFTRSKWSLDHEIPVFTADRNYIENLLTCEEI